LDPSYPPNVSPPSASFQIFAHFVPSVHSDTSPSPPLESLSSSPRPLQQVFCLPQFFLFGLDSMSSLRNDVPNRLYRSGLLLQVVHNPSVKRTRASHHTFPPFLLQPLPPPPPVPLPPTLPTAPLLCSPSTSTLPVSPSRDPQCTAKLFPILFFAPSWTQ